MKHKVDVHKLVHDLGGPTELYRRLEKDGYGDDISVKGIDAWIARDRIPGKWLPVLLDKTRGTLRDYMVRAEVEDGGKDADFLA